MGTGRDAVTGAFGYVGQAVARALLARGRRVLTLSRRSGAGSDLADRIEVAPQDFEAHDALVARLRGCETLYNTWWIRFERGPQTFAWAVERSARLFRAAREAGVARLVHVSVTNCREDHELPYYAGKAAVERHARAAGMSCAIVRPTLVFGPGDILLNNVAWLMRACPFFVVPGDGSYRLQPVHLDDLARLLVEAGARRDEETFDAAGPDVLTWNGLVALLGRSLGLSPRVWHWPPWLALLGCRAIGRWKRDVLLTGDELRGLRQELLLSHEPPRGTTRLVDWLAGAAPTLGQAYASELGRHFRGFEGEAGRATP